MSSPVKLKLKRKGRAHTKAKDTMKHLDQSHLSVGHFSDGEHSSGFNYAELMAIQHLGLGGQAPRPLMSVLKIGGLKDPAYRVAFNRWAAAPQSKANNNRLIDDFGKITADNEYDLFGKVSNKMPPTTSPKKVGVDGPTAPLVDTGELRDNIRFKNSNTPAKT
jgi:hypothetical protein